MTRKISRTEYNRQFCLIVVRMLMGYITESDFLDREGKRIKIYFKGEVFPKDFVRFGKPSHFNEVTNEILNIISKLEPDDIEIGVRHGTEGIELFSRNEYNEFVDLSRPLHFRDVVRKMLDAIGRLDVYDGHVLFIIKARSPVLVRVQYRYSEPKGLPSLCDRTFKASPIEY